MKAWHMMVFSLIPLALLMMGVAIGSLDGVDSQREVLAAPPAQEGGPSAPPAEVPEGATVLEVVAKNLQFSPRNLSAPAETEVLLRFDNQDAGVLHNVAFYTDNRAGTQIFVSELFAGPGTRDESFTTPEAGTYFFRCDVHPDTMTGQFTVR